MGNNGHLPHLESDLNCNIENCDLHSTYYRCFSDLKTISCVKCILNFRLSWTVAGRLPLNLKHFNGLKIDKLNEEG